MLENELQNSWRLSIPFNRFQRTISIHQFQSIKLGALSIKKLCRIAIFISCIYLENNNAI